MPAVDDEGRIQTVTLTSAAGLAVTLIDAGAGIRSIRVPTKRGVVEACLGYERLSDYRHDPYYLGATVGRYANRIRNAAFELDGERFELDANETTTGHCLHGGRDGLHRVAWQFEASGHSATFVCRSPDGAGGFPGNVDISVDYQLLNDFSLQIDYRAVSDRDTVFNLANHAYFNLGLHSETIDEHRLSVFADRYTPVDDSKIPLGAISDVEGTRFDLRQGVALSDDAETFDHNFVLADAKGDLRLAAELRAADSGLTMRLHTTQPALQVYTGDYLGAPFRPRQGVCLEAQRFPDAPNRADFPSARLAAGEGYEQRTVYEFLPESH